MIRRRTLTRAQARKIRRLVRKCYRRMPAAAIAARVGLGQSDRSIRNFAHRLGLGGFAVNLPGFTEFLRTEHARGMTDHEIAAAWQRRTGRPCDYHTISRRRRAMGLPSNAGATSSDHHRRKVATKTYEQLQRAGGAGAGFKHLVDVRRAAWRAFARRCGWPEDLQPRAVQMLNVLWDHGPDMRRNIAVRIGIDPRAKDGRGNSYLGTLIRRGLVISLGRCVRTGKGKGCHACLYSIAPGVQRGNHADKVGAQQLSFGQGHDGAAGVAGAGIAAIGMGDAVAGRRRAAG